MFQLQTELVGGGARSIGAPEGGIYRRAAGRSPVRYFRPVLDLIRQRLSARKPSQGFRGRVALVSSSGEAGSPSGHLEALMAGRRLPARSFPRVRHFLSARPEYACAFVLSAFFTCSGELARRVDGLA